MTKITATIFIENGYKNNDGFMPTHYIMLSENDRHCLTLKRIDSNKEIIKIIPTVENIVDEIFLIIHTFVIKADILLDNSMTGKEMHKLFNEQKGNLKHDVFKQSFETFDVKVIFNILSDSILLNRLNRIKEYPIDFEVTTPKFKRECDFFTGKVEFTEY